MGKFIAGLPTHNNLDKWQDYAKRNSYGNNKAQCRAQWIAGAATMLKTIGL